MCAHVHACVRVCARVCACVRVCARMRAPERVCARVCACVRMCARLARTGFAGLRVARYFTLPRLTRTPVALRAADRLDNRLSPFPVICIK